MYRKLFLAGLALTAMAAPGQSETRFRGNVIFTAVKNCDPGAAQVGWSNKSEFHAPVSGNDNFSALSLIYSHGGIGHRLDNAKFTNVFKATKTGGVGWGDMYVAKRQSSILISSQQPATLLPTTPSVTLVGKFKNVWGDIGNEQCEVTFHGVYVRMLD
jgi:hypothetical protein